MEAKERDKVVFPTPPFWLITEITRAPMQRL